MLYAQCEMKEALLSLFKNNLHKNNYPNFAAIFKSTLNA